MSLGVQKTIELLVLPPGVLVLLGVLGVLLWYRRPRLARMSSALLVLALYLLSTSVVANLLTRAVVAGYGLEAVDLAALARGEHGGAQAIVVLGAGRRSRALEYAGADTLSARSLERVRYAAQLARASGLDVLVSGGSPLVAGRTSEAALMRDVLVDEFRVAVRWLEERSRTTAENASMSAPLLVADGVERVLLVTHGLHMPRALQSFSVTPLEVWPAPFDMPQAGHRPTTGGDLLPTMQSLGTSSFAIHELVGRAWYRLKGLRT